MAKTGVIGAGSWGIALSVLLHNNGHEVTVWSALKDEIADLKEKHEHRTLPGVKLPKSMVFTDDLEEAMADRELLVLAVPSIYTRATAASMKPFCPDGQIPVSYTQLDV